MTPHLTRHLTQTHNPPPGRRPATAFFTCPSRRTGCRSNIPRNSQKTLPTDATALDKNWSPSVYFCAATDCTTTSDTPSVVLHSVARRQATQRSPARLLERIAASGLLKGLCGRTAQLLICSGRDALFAALHDDAVNVQNNAAEALVEIGGPSVPLSPVISEASGYVAPRDCNGHAPADRLCIAG
jgi:hypothetical protein